MRLVSAAVPQVQELRKNIQLPQATPEALLFFFRRRLRERKSREISPTENISLASPSTRFLDHLQESRAQASDPAETTLATFCVATSSNPEPQVKSKTLTYVQRPRLVGPSVRVLRKPSPKRGRAGSASD